MLHAGTSVLGDEQVLDVELDRHTVFRPVTERTLSPDPWDLHHGSPPRVQAEPAPALPGMSWNYLSWFKLIDVIWSFVFVFFCLHRICCSP
jgi:hypothetical protein